jgi:hypothetical protein
MQESRATVGWTDGSRSRRRWRIRQTLIKSPGLKSRERINRMCTGLDARAALYGSSGRSGKTRKEDKTGRDDGREKGGEGMKGG